MTFTHLIPNIRILLPAQFNHLLPSQEVDKMIRSKFDCFKDDGPEKITTCETCLIIMTKYNRKMVISMQENCQFIQCFMIEYSFIFENFFLHKDTPNKMRGIRENGHGKSLSLRQMAIMEPSSAFFPPFFSLFFSFLSFFLPPFFFFILSCLVFFFFLR